MKHKILVLFSAIVLSVATTSCTDYLNVDKYFYDQVSLDSAFSKRIYVEGWLANAFSHMMEVHEAEDIPKWLGDDIVNVDVKAYQHGDYSPTSGNGYSNNLLYKGYEAIRKASTFIDNVNRCPELSYDEITDMTGQMRFLRAYAYWALIRHFGPVPLVPEHGADISLSYEELSLPRNSFDEIVNFIDNDLVLAARLLPKTRTVNNMGHPTRGAALALRSRILLFAASPLMNGNTDLFNVKDNEGNQLVNQVYDEYKWARAAAAAKEVIELDAYELYIQPADVNAFSWERPPYNAEFSDKDYPEGWANVDPYTSYKSNFDGSIIGSKNPELIFTLTKDGSKHVNDWWVSPAVPKTLRGGNKLGVTQSQVDAYYMANGKSINDTGSGYEESGFTTSSNPEEAGGRYFLGENVSLQYAGREPRFYASIGFPGSTWACESATEAQYRGRQIFYYRNLEDGKVGFKEDCPLTGITIKKYYNDEDAFTTGGYRKNKTEPIMRYAEILLNYAEALNELTTSHIVTGYNGQEITVSRGIDQMRYAMKRIRMRAGLPDFTNEEYNDVRIFREKLKRERRIELFGEIAARYYDLRRWKDALEYQNNPFMGCDINVGETEREKFYIPTMVTSIPRYFEQKMYLWPIPNDEIKRNVNMTQNPGWE